MDEAEIERELLMDVDAASSSEQEQEEEREERFISSMVSLMQTISSSPSS